VTRQPYYDRYMREGRCCDCTQPSDYGARCWRCTLRKQRGERDVKQAELDRVLAELAETEALIARLEVADGN